MAEASNRDTDVIVWKKQGPGEYTATLKTFVLELSRTVTKKSEWEWAIWTRFNPQPLDYGTEARLQGAKMKAAQALGRITDKKKE
jgi:hypothetical protein